MQKIYVVKGFRPGEDSILGSPPVDENYLVYEGAVIQSQHVDNGIGRGIMTNVYVNGKLVAQNFKRR